jgi:hypothetical protein
MKSLLTPMMVCTYVVIINSVDGDMESEDEQHYGEETPTNMRGAYVLSVTDIVHRRNYSSYLIFYHFPGNADDETHSCWMSEHDIDLIDNGTNAIVEYQNLFIREKR